MTNVPMATCPTPEEVETVRYAFLAQQNGYKDPRALLDDIAPMVARGQVTTLPVCHPSLYDKVKDLTSDWSFDELHSCASHHRRQCPLSLKQLREKLDKPQYEALRYVLLKLATERPTDAPDRRVLKMIGGFESFSAAMNTSSVETNPASMFDLSELDEMWFIAPELNSLFNMRESSEISRASRHLSTTHGHYLIRRSATDADYENISRRYTYVYRPASFEEKVRDLADNFGYTVENLALESEYSSYEIQEILDKKDVPLLNPFDTTQHEGEVNFENVEPFLRERFQEVVQADDVVFTPDLSEGSVVAIAGSDHDIQSSIIDPYYPYFTPSTPVIPTHRIPGPPVTYPEYVTYPQPPLTEPVSNELEVRVEAILSFAKVTGVTVEISTLVEATNSSLKEVLGALSALDQDLLDSTLA